MYYLPSSELFTVIDQAFQSAFYRKDSISVQSTINGLICLNDNLAKLEEEENRSGNHSARVEKLSTLIHKYR